ncbi:MAG: S1/P1 nuclease [Armatimonas sp.]
MRRLSLATVILLAPTLAHAWGGDGHQYTARIAVASLPDSPLKRSLEKNVDWFAVSSSHPDRWRTRPDAAENARHFLDTERFGFGTDISKIPQDYAEVQKIRDYTKLREDGVNPWTVRRIHANLVVALKEKRWADAYVQMAYLSHYLGDAHVPFHASENYDGQLSNPSQKGIHSRFESQMLERTIKFSDLTPGAPIAFTDPVKDTFTALGESLKEVPGILAADRAAADSAGGTDSDAYWSSFTAKSRPVAIQRLQTAGRRLAGALILAWDRAGRPKLPGDFSMDDRWLPYASAFAPRGTPPSPAQPPISDEEKASARTYAKVVDLESKALGKTTKYTLLLPRDYDAHPTRRYPVLFLLHGASGNHADWNKLSGIAAYAATLPLIIVMPDAGGDSFYSNSAGFGNVQTYFEKELIPHVDKTYRTLNKREGRAIAGLSMGGYGSWHLALSNPKTFCAAASLSGAIGWGDGPLVEGGLRNFAMRLWPTKPEDGWKASALWPKVEKLYSAKKGWQGPALYFDCGKDDFLIESNRTFDRKLMELGMPYEFAEFNGAHTWPYWDEHVRDAINFAMRHLDSAK